MSTKATTRQKEVFTPKIRLFDTILNVRHKNTVARNSSDVWKAYTQLTGWGFNYERMHTIADADFFLTKAISEDVLIFSGHGDNEDGFCLSNEKPLKPEDIAAFSKEVGTADKFIILSACRIGRNAALLNEYKEAFQAQRVFAYRHDVIDNYCFLLESILLEYLSRQGGFTEKQFADYQSATAFLKNFNQAGVKTHPMVMV